jgi:NADH:ubiquinone oxidoreductase subunit D
LLRVVKVPPTFSTTSSTSEPTTRRYHSDLEFDILVGYIPACKNGGYLVSMVAMRQAVRIMKHCLEQLRLPEGQKGLQVNSSI